MVQRLLHKPPSFFQICRQVKHGRGSSLKLRGTIQMTGSSDHGHLQSAAAGGRNECSYWVPIVWKARERNLGLKDVLGAIQLAG